MSSKLKPKSKLNPGAKQFIPKSKLKPKSKLNPGAKQFIPELPGFNKFIDYNASYNNKVKDLVRNTKEKYADIVERYMTIFQYVCNTRNLEIQYAQIGKYELEKKKSNYEAFLDLRTFKDNESSDKVKKYYELLELEEELLDVFKTKKKVYQFIDTLNETSLFEKFMDEYPQCDSRIHPSLDYAGLKKYLKKSLLRENIKIKRKNKNFPKL
jgi:hypothetical protein